MIDKRGLMRDYRIARTGLSRRIRLRIRSTRAASVASVDPLSDAAPLPSTDVVRYITGQFDLLKTTQQYDEAGAIQQERGAVYFHSMWQDAVQESYSMYIGGTGKEWNRISLPKWDDARCALKVYVEAQQ